MATKIDNQEIYEGLHLLKKVVKVLKGTHQDGREWQIMVVDEPFIGDRKVHQKLINQLGIEVVNYGEYFKNAKQ